MVGLGSMYRRLAGLLYGGLRVDVGQGGLRVCTSIW